jgi:signal transduction histidine kinase/DNA-binding response OmpR family regulator
MTPFQAFTLGSRLIAMVTCSALAILVLFQLRHDAKSRLFGLLMIDITAVAFFGSLSRLASALDYGDEAVFVMFTIGSIFTGTLPALIFIFAVELLGVWTAWRRGVARALVLAGCIAATQFTVGRAFVHFTMSREGYLNYTLSPLVNFLLAIGEIGVLLSLRVAFEQYFRKRNEANIRLLAGFTILCVGYLTIIVKEVNQYSPQLVFFAISSVVMASPILQHRLFDPLSQLNVKLARRAEQLSILTRVGQQATSFLKQDELLDVIIKEIQHAFNYYAVAICLPNNEDRQMVVKAAAGAHADAFVTSGMQWAVADDSLIGAAALSRQVINVGNVQVDTRYASHSLRPHTRSEVSLPLVVGAENAEQTLIGVLDIQSDQRDAFSPEDIEVLQILANQIAIAIRNAQLFEEAQRARQLADEANRKKTKFLSEMSHELRTPLQVVITRSQWMLKHPEMYGGVALPRTYIADLASIETSGKLLHSLINNILDLSKIEAGEVNVEISVIDPLPILRDAQQGYTALLPQGVELCAEYPEHLPYILGNDLHIKQILGNLLSNACKFTQQGRIRLDAQVVDGHLRFSVADTGPGIPPEVQALLFKPFTQGSREITRKYGGTGLGLHLCKQLVTLYKGDIGCTSEEGQGATFYFTIPLARPEDLTPGETSVQQPASRAAIFPRQPRQLPAQILVIDLQPTTREQLATGLSQAGYSVAIAETTALGRTLSTLLALYAVVIVIHSDSPGEILELAHSCRQENNLKSLAIIESKAVEGSTLWQRELIGQLHPDRAGVEDIPGNGAVLTSLDQISTQAVIFARNARNLPLQILLVDMHADTQAQLETALSQAGYAVLVAGTASLGIALGACSAPGAIVVIHHADNLVEMQALTQLLHNEKNLENVPIIDYPMKEESASWKQTLLAQLSQIVCSDYRSSGHLLSENATDGSPRWNREVQ